MIARFAAVDGEPEAAQRMGGSGSDDWRGLEVQNGLIYTTGAGYSTWEADYAAGTLDQPDSAFVPNTVYRELLTIKLNAAAPIVSITSPPNALLVEPGTPVTLAGTTDGGPISWSSSIDGWLGQGNTITVSLSPGVHLITASSTNGLRLTGLTGTRVRALSEVTIQASDPAAAEQGNDTGQFTVIRSNSYGALTVKYSVGGTAAADDYFESLTGSLAFADGELSKTILVTPVDDHLGEGSDTIVLTLRSDHAPPEHPQTYLIGSPDSATVTIADNDQPPQVFDRAVSETTVSGTVTSGSLAATLASDNVYEGIREVQTGSGGKRKSVLERRWTFNVTGGQTATFSVEAYHTANTEGDDFVFAYSKDNVNYTNMFTLTKTADNNQPQTYALPSGISGTVYVRVKDKDQTAGRSVMDTIYVDDMFIVSVGGVARGSSQSMAALAGGTVAPLDSKGSSVAVAMTEASNEHCQNARVTSTARRMNWSQSV
jgi:hypothetical protein